MKENNKRKRWGFLILLLAIIPISLAVLSALAMSASSAVTQAELDEALEKSRLERSVLLLADEQRNEIRTQMEAERQMKEAERQQLESRLRLGTEDSHDAISHATTVLEELDQREQQVGT